MQIYVTKIRVTEPLLGDCPSHDGVYRFARTSDDKRLLLDSSRMHFCFDEAIRALDLQTTVSASQIRADCELRPPTLHRFVRQFTKNGKRTEVLHESIRTGTVLTFEVAVLEQAEPGGDGLRGPEQHELVGILTVIGKYMGISPWGSKFEYGRFTVEACERIRFVGANAP